MCLSTIYRNTKDENNILCKFVATINADGSISIPNFAMWYYFDGDGWYYYTLGTSILTK